MSARGQALVLAALAAGAPEALGCTSCMSGGDGPMLSATRLGIWLLLGVTVAVEGAFAAFFLYLWRRARRTSGQAAGTHVEAS